MTENTMPPVDETPRGHGSGEYPYWQDLNPDFLAGENRGLEGPQSAANAASAYDVKGAHALPQSWEDDDLKQIPILPAGGRLQQGATYINLRDTQPQPFTARGDMEATKDTWYVPKDRVPYTLWNRLTGVTDPERLDQASER